MVTGTVTAAENSRRRLAEALQRTWDGRCTVTVRRGRMDASTGRMIYREEDVCRDLPCRLLFRRQSPVQRQEYGAMGAQEVILLTSRDATIPTGSRLSIRQNGMNYVYAHSGTPAVYATHQEVALSFFGGWS